VEPKHHLGERRKDNGNTHHHLTATAVTNSATTMTSLWLHNYTHRALTKIPSWHHPVPQTKQLMTIHSDSTRVLPLGAEQNCALCLPLSLLKMRKSFC
jgi:hypothetical protein